MKKLKIFFSTLFLLLFFGLLYSYAEVSIIQSSLSWRQDAAGDYVMPKPVNGEYSPAEFVAIAGQIKSICANYDATGPVALEVSADNGLHYYALINGVPLASDFVSGDRLRWRAKLLDVDAKLNSLSITYTDSAGAIATFGSPQLSGFNYRKAILLKNPSQQELFNYQLKLKIEEGIASSPTAPRNDSNATAPRNDVIANPPEAGEAISVNCAGHILADFKDIRFTAADAQTPLPYYRESISGASPKQVATFWVRVPQLPKDGVKIYIYYGNTQAPDLSSPKDTFDFYDDFKNADLDADVWVVKTDQKGSYALRDGQIKLDAAELITKDFQFKQGIVEYAVSVESGFENSLSLRTKTNGIYDNPGLILYSSAYKGAEHCIAIDDIVKANDAEAAPIAAAGKYNYRLTVNGKELTFERMDGATTEAQAKVNYITRDTLRPGYLGLKSGGDGGGRNTIAYSFIRVRKFAAPEPQVAQTSEEEQVRLPIFSNIALSEKGNLILANDSKEGTYISKTIPAAFTCRIMVPTFEGTQANVSISADNGANYKEDCASGDYYYSSRKDFTSGANIVAKVRLSPGRAQSASAELEEVKLDYSPGTISMVKPNGSEAWGQGSSQDIFWSALGYDKEYPIKLEYSLDNGQMYTGIADKVENSGSYTWRIPENIESTQALIRASDSNDPAVNDVSDDVFTIQSPGAGAEKAEVMEQEIAQGEQLAKQAQEKKEAQKQVKAEISDINKNYVIDKDVTISTGADIAFKTLTLGDGGGRHTSRIILNNNINPKSGSIIIRRGGEFIQANTTNQAISADLVIEEGGLLTHLANKAEKQYQINLTAQNITLKPGAMVSAYAKGYSGGDVRQDGLGKAAGKYIGKGASGGSYGGAGGSSLRAEGEAIYKDSTYDTARMPSELGSGGAGSWSARGGAGGGAIKLAARNEFSISGIINADGEAGAVSADNTYDAAGGAGGSIYLSAQKFSGSGAKITASGGTGNKSAGGGGGGRINIQAPAGKISGTLNANGGSGAKPGLGGTDIVE